MCLLFTKKVLHPKGFFLCDREPCCAASHNIYNMVSTCDFHNDILTAKGMPAAEDTAGLDCGVFALYKGNRSFSQLFALAESFVQCNENPRVRIAFEELSEITDCELETLISLRPAYATLTWNFENDLAYGCYSDGRLKARGKEVCRQLMAGGVPIDTAHLCKRSFFDVCDCGNGLVDSHTCFSSVREHVRNIDEEQVSLLRERDAPIGIAFVGAFLAEGGAGAEDVVRHVDWYVQKYGAAGIGFGTDFYGTQDLPRGIRNYKNLFVLVEKFLKIGYNEEVIEQIFYHNLTNFLFVIKTNDGHEHLRKSFNHAVRK